MGKNICGTPKISKFCGTLLETFFKIRKLQQSTYFWFCCQQKYIRIMKINFNVFDRCYSRLICVLMNITIEF